METKRGIAIFNLQAGLNSKNNVNFVIQSSRMRAKFRALIIRAKLDGEFVDPIKLDGARVYYILAMKKDSYNNERPYLYLYGRSDNLYNLEGLRYLTVTALYEKHTSMGGLIKHEIPSSAEILLDEELWSGGGTHWDRHLVMLIHRPLILTKHYTSNLGNSRVSEVAL